MSRRTQRVGSLIQRLVGEGLLRKLNDPRVDPARTSVTRVEVPDDLLSAKVYISVMGTETEQKLALQAIRHAKGYFQQLVADNVRLRNTPSLEFLPDEKFKKTLHTYRLIDEAMAEIREKEEQAARQDDRGDE